MLTIMNRLWIDPWHHFGRIVFANRLPACHSSFKDAWWTFICGWLDHTGSAISTEKHLKRCQVLRCISLSWFNLIACFIFWRLFWYMLEASKNPSYFLSSAIAFIAGECKLFLVGPCRERRLGCRVLHFVSQWDAKSKKWLSRLRGNKAKSSHTHTIYTQYSYRWEREL